MRVFSVIFILLFVSGCKKETSPTLSQKVTITSLAKKPISFSWTNKANVTKPQSAYQLVVFKKDSSGQKHDQILWDSGKVKSAKTAFITYNGPKLKGGQTYYSKVKVWNQKDTPSQWSPSEKWIEPLHYPEDWDADWITYDYTPEQPLPVFRKKFSIEKQQKIDYAQLYIAAPGFYEAYINGKKIGENELDPAQTNYEDYIFYTSYAIPVKQLNSQNILGVQLGNGWYNQNVVWNSSMVYGNPLFIAQLELHFTDGTKTTITSDNSWKWQAGPITFSNIYTGEHYDARKEVKDWFDLQPKSNWKQAIVAEKPTSKLVQQFAEPVKVMDSLVPKKITPLANGKYIFDFGQNFAGKTRLRIKGNKGQKITLRYAEELGKNGLLDFRSTGIKATKHIQTEEYTCKGNELEIWEPKFTYHGFRYAEISGLRQKPTKALLTGLVLYSSMKKAGHFESSNSNLNKLDTLNQWSLKSNLIGIPTDCPHREKCGWLGDTQTIAKTLIYNFNAHKFLTKYLYDIRSSGRTRKKELHFGYNFHDRSIISKPKGIPTMIAPGKRTSGIASPGWGTALTQIPWDIYLYYGDKTVLKEFYPDMKHWVNYIESEKENGLIPNGLGDWCPPGGNKNIDCPVALSSSAFHILDVSILIKSAKALGLQADKQKYGQLKKALVAVFNQSFLDRKKMTYGSQTANSMALQIGIAPRKLRKKIAKAIVTDSRENFNGFLNTGIFGLPRIFQALSENGYEQTAYDILSKKENNSFEAMWNHYSATTLWEILPTSTAHGSYDAVKDVSHNHMMQGGFDAYFYSGIAGINPTPEAPGFKKIIFKPYLTRQLDHAQASYKSRFGTIESKWKHNQGKLYWEITIPKNSSGEIYVPSYGRKISVQINGKDIGRKKTKANFTALGSFGAGNYQLVITQIQP